MVFGFHLRALAWRCLFWMNGGYRIDLPRVLSVIAVCCSRGFLAVWVSARHISVGDSMGFCLALVYNSMRQCVLSALHFPTCRLLFYGDCCDVAEENDCSMMPVW